MKKSIWIYIFRLILVCVIIFQTNYLSARAEIEFQISSKKSIYHLGEPIIIETKIINFSDETITINKLKVGLLSTIIRIIKGEKDLTYSSKMNTIYRHDIFEEIRDSDIYIDLCKNEFFGRFINFSKEINKPGEYEFFMQYKGPITKDIEIGGVKVSAKYILLNSNRLIIKIVDKEKNEEKKPKIKLG